MTESYSRLVGRLAPLAALLAASTGALAEGALFVVSPAVLDPDAPIAADVKAECKLPGVMGENAVQYAQRQLRRQGGAVRISDLKEAGDGRALLVTIVAAYGEGATMYSGHKSITVRADLIQGGKVIDSRIVRQSAKMGSFWAGGGALAGSCDVFARASRLVANRVGSWARGAGTPVLVAADRRVAVESPASVDRTVSFPEEVMRECALPMMLSTHVFDRVSIELKGSRMVRPGEGADEKLLRVTILEVHRPKAEDSAPGKSIVARADVLDGGKVIAHKEFARVARGSAITCLAFETAAVDIGQEVSRWLPGVTGAVARDKPLETVKEDADDAEK